MTDRELLEAAARAAGINVHWNDAVGMMFLTPSDPRDRNIEWNPLENDGDALRLAVKLSIEVNSDVFNRDTQVLYSTDVLGIGVILESHNVDPLAATRRAIVRAAAEIGLKEQP